MASPAAAPAEFTQQDAARQSLIAISSQSPPESGSPIRSPDGGMADAHHAAADDKYRTKLISISNQSPDARSTPCPAASNPAA
ncbi:hypothetical protein PR202_gb14537 [Eleusine coracana subsp. coracana]|uniref:Uncharacterized protein n=1 Tax=Eleusine coracana subsp. coracana TaxID=191504 RepID=A0AAV5ET76_ELECO|nr:hypothetical protein QOZ80_4BG0336900 [Eleusine coracana subsp. coracana]GJN26593.1 hypothetical protein PR202_gb14537 [Eleusine coracana subsp. coracana]